MSRASAFHMNSHKKKSTATTPSKIRAGARLSKPDRMEQRLREQYEAGRAAVAAEIAKGTKTDQYAKEHNLNPHSLRKLKAFARAYYVSGDTQTKGRTSLEELCRHRRKNPSRPSSRLVLHWGHVVSRSQQVRYATAHGDEPMSVEFSVDCWLV